MSEKVIQINSRGGRSLTIDYLKAICIIFVILHHSIVYHSDYRGFFLDYIVSVHVKCFILIAGYLCHKQNIKNYLKKKFFRLIVPLWFFSTLKIIYSLLFSSDYIHGGSVSEILYEYYIVGSGYWFIYCLFIMYLIAIPLWQVKRNLVICGITIFSVLLNIGFEIHDVTLPEVFQIANTIAYIPYFLIGYSIKHLNTGEVNNQTRILILILSILVSFALDYLNYTINVDSFYLFSLVHTLARITALYLIVDGLFANRKIRVLDLLSKYSLQLMFFDSFYKVFIFMLAEAIGLSTASLQIAIILAFLNIVFGTISCCIAKRIPALRTAIGI